MKKKEMVKNEMKKPKKDSLENSELKLAIIEDIEEVEIIETGNFCTCTSTTTKT